MSLIEKRVDRLREQLAQKTLEGILITNLTNVRYLSGFSGSAGSCLIYSDKSYFITDGRYLTQSKEQVKEMEIIVDLGSHLDIIKKNGLIKSGITLGLEGDFLTVNRMEKMKEFFPEVKWISTSGIVEKIAAIKDESEIRALRIAIAITDEVFNQIIPELRVGVAEREIAAKISYACKMLGAEGDSFIPIVASGANSALPHAVTGDKTFEEGDFVVMDFGALYNGYHADMTRTVVVGSASDRHREIYEIVKEAQQRGCNAAKAGIACKELDAVTRNYITEQGYEKYFVHGTGHGIGLEIHTMPKVSQISEEILLENYVVTIEPGIYIPDFGGVRIEDDIIIKKDGCEILNRSTKEMLIVG